MKLSLNWLKDFVKIPDSISPQKLGELITLHTAEVEEIIDESKQFENMLIGRVQKIKAHPNADKLSLVEIDIGDKIVGVVCGGNNLKEGMLIAYAGIGAQVNWHGEGKMMTLEKVNIRGVESSGMICAGEEIGLPPAKPGGISDLSYLKVKPGTPLHEALNRNDVILEIDNKSITHRPDLWGHYGMAREIGAIFGEGSRGSKLKTYKARRFESSKNEKLSIEVKNPDLCPRYLGVVINNVTIKESPDWLKNRLQAIGYRPICNIVDVTNYVMAELGQPLHAFDKNLINGGIVVRKAQAKEKIVTLDGKERELSSEMLVIADHAKVLAVAGVMGGADSEINESTTSIIVEAANFNKINVRQTSTKLGLRSEAAARFEKGLDSALAQTAILKAIELILKICKKAMVESEIVDVSNFENKANVIELNLEKLNSKIGKKLSKKEVAGILKSLEFKINSAGKILSVTVPTFRSQGDISTEDDLIEEVARIYGYDNLAPELPHLPINLPRENRERLREHEARSILSYGLGLSEVYNYSFYNAEDIKKSKLTEDDHILVENYLSQDQTHMRLSLLPNMLKAISHNLKQSKEFGLYELGRVYKKDKIGGKFWPEEKKQIMAALVKPMNYNQAFQDLREFLEMFLIKFGYANHTFGEVRRDAINRVSTDFIIGGKTIGQIGLVDPMILKNYDIQASVAVFEIDFAGVNNEDVKNPTIDKAESNYLLDQSKNEFQYQPIPKFPGLSFDVSVLVDETKTCGELQKTIISGIKAIGENVLQSDIEIFDIYRGKNIPEGKKSLAFNITLTHPEKTLEDKDLRLAQEYIFKALEKAGGVIRGNRE